MYFVVWYARIRHFLKFVYETTVFASFFEICSYSFDEVQVSLLPEFAFN
jgi:hypothetical protein